MVLYTKYAKLNSALQKRQLYLTCKSNSKTSETRLFFICTHFEIYYIRVIIRVILDNRVVCFVFCLDLRVNLRHMRSFS